MTQSNKGFSDNIIGMGWMLGAVVLFCALHALIRITAEKVPVLEIVFFRNLFGALVLFPLLLKHGLAPLKTKRIGMFAGRAALNSGAMALFFTALAIAPLADVTALSFLGPIFASAIAVLVFKEKVGHHRWFAISLGFVGALVIVRPGLVAIDQGTLFVLIASVLWAGTLIVIKSLAKTESSLTITLYMTIMMTPLTLVPALFVWEWPQGEDWLWLLAIALLGTVAQYCMTESLRLGETHVVMPMDYTRLLWLAIIGGIVFQETPDIYTIIGGIIIAISASYIAWREALKSKAARINATNQEIIK